MKDQDYFLRRRTVRTFSEEKVASSVIERLLRASAQAPNTGNMQLYAAIVTDSADELAELAEAHYRQPASTGCRVMVTFCADVHRFSRWASLRKGDGEALDNLQGLMWATIDATIAAQQFVTAAEMEGLGTCYLGTTLYTAGEISRILRLPKGVVPIVTVALGWPAAEETGKAPTERLPLKAVVHHGHYHDYSDSEIEELYAETETMPQSEKFVAENGLETLAQVFTQVRYPREASERMSEELAALLAEKGFRLPR